MNEQNPFLTKYETPHQTTPFNLIRNEHFEPAMMEGMKRQNEEIDHIIQNPEPPTFENTLEELEKSGELLGRVTTVFSNLMSADTNDEMDAIAEKMMPMLTAHSNNITLNDNLFQRIKAVYDQKDSLHLDEEQKMLLEKTYDGFIRCGANLSKEDKEVLRKLTTEMSLLTLQFSQNHLKATHQYELAVTQDQLEGLPEHVIRIDSPCSKTLLKEHRLVMFLIKEGYGSICPDRDLFHILRILPIEQRTRKGIGGESINRFKNLMSIFFT